MEITPTMNVDAENPEAVTAFNGLSHEARSTTIGQIETIIARAAVEKYGDDLTKAAAHLLALNYGPHYGESTRKKIAALLNHMNDEGRDYVEQQALREAAEVIMKYFKDKVE